VRGYNQTGYNGEFYLLGDGNVKQTSWTPNRLDYDLNVPAPTSLVINQNMYPGWHVVEGDGETYSEHGLIAVLIPSGKQQIEIAYTPTHIVWAYLLTFIATVVLIAVWLIEKRGALPQRAVNLTAS